ncbi:hypothetical protein AB1N83_007284 [Pleurotus pulmonarius]
MSSSSHPVGTRMRVASVTSVSVLTDIGVVQHAEAFLDIERWFSTNRLGRWYLSDCAKAIPLWVLVPHCFLSLIPWQTFFVSSSGPIMHRHISNSPLPPRLRFTAIRYAVRRSDFARLMFRWKHEACPSSSYQTSDIGSFVIRFLPVPLPLRLRFTAIHCGVRIPDSLGLKSRPRHGSN